MPLGRLTPEQDRLARRLAGTMYYQLLAKRVGVSRSTIMRWAHYNSVNVNALAYKPEVVEAVCAYYEKHGKEATQKRFPNVRVRSIVERHKDYRPRQIRWTNKQIIEAAKMAGVVSFEGQAKFFNRPNANAGSIKYLWHKRFKFGMQTIHGMSAHLAKDLVTKDCPYVASRFWRTKRKGQVFGRKLYLWVDMENYLRPEVPDFIREGVETLAEFQRWLFKSEHPKRNVVKLIRHREIGV